MFLPGSVFTAKRERPRRVEIVGKFSNRNDLSFPTGWGFFLEWTERHALGVVPSFLAHPPIYDILMGVWMGCGHASIVDARMRRSS